MKVAFPLIIALQDAGAPFTREVNPVCDAFVYSEIPAARSGSSRMRRAVDLRRSGVKHLIDTRSWPSQATVRPRCSAAMTSSGRPNARRLPETAHDSHA